ncbi:hypothetical protein [Myxococcus xanthus]|uniref:Uncharacterized protein n=1 Tax=Myxococcus xanthus TaxID=34 RepID=A0A7Y4MQC9_MYXXA|nr:hypothetical protein [Myxococcus xanthus]NOJ78330.1 hypothetical protein [Myxococcus xanthus]NOJ85424.1 hypothetical protein [Myxococcus xanthus]
MAKRTGRPIVLDNGVPFIFRLARTALEAALPYVRAFRLPKCTFEALNWRNWAKLNLSTEPGQAHSPCRVR